MLDLSNTEASAQLWCGWGGGSHSQHRTWLMAGSKTLLQPHVPAQRYQMRHINSFRNNPVRFVLKGECWWGSLSTTLLLCRAQHPGSTLSITRLLMGKINSPTCAQTKVNPSQTNRHGLQLKEAPTISFAGTSSSACSSSGHAPTYEMLWAGSWQGYSCSLPPCFISTNSN